jgi:hypothetical protein
MTQPRVIVITAREPDKRASGLGAKHRDPRDGATGEESRMSALGIGTRPRYGGTSSDREEFQAHHGGPRCSPFSQ